MSLTLKIARAARLTAVGSFAVLAAACGVNTPSAPSVSAPSEFGTSITLSATPEILVQDGVSQAVITAVARDAASKPISGLAIRWDAAASTPRVLPVILSSSTSLTNAEGRAVIVLTAPDTPTEKPSNPDFITVTATPVSGSVDDVQKRSVRVQLQPPAGVPLANNPPVAAFVARPSIGVVNEPMTFDAQTTTDEREPCLSRCTYLWEFGDGTTATGMVVSHTYSVAMATPGYKVTLTVVDDRNGVHKAEQFFVVNGTAPVARFTVSPATPQVGVNAAFDATGTSVGSGVVITSYQWSFGDGDVQTTTQPTISKRYDEARQFAVTLTVTDNLNRTSTVGQTIQVVP